MTEYYAPKARAEAEAVEATVWALVKGRFADNTVRWADLLEHPQTGKFGIVLPDDWRELDTDIIKEVDILAQEDMETANWFLSEVL